jgi:Zn-dependent metalloprotease
MEEEPELLGIIKPEEIREVNINTSKGYNGDYTNVNYQRYINGIELKNADMQITIGPNENISGISARLVPVSLEVYEATKKKTLSEEEIRSIIENDLRQNNIDPKSGIPTYHKIAILSPPYVVWIVRRHWIYTINAFTGEIIEKASAEEYLK